MSEDGPSYLDYFNRHALETKNPARQLDGIVYQELQKEVKIGGSEWSANERYNFFGFLERYGNKRPDLIAKHIATKTVMEVMALIDYYERLIVDADLDKLPLSSHAAAVEATSPWIYMESAEAERIEKVVLDSGRRGNMGGERSLISQRLDYDTAWRLFLHQNELCRSTKEKLPVPELDADLQRVTTLLPEAEFFNVKEMSIERK
jgi:hypothetical protein